MILCICYDCKIDYFCAVLIKKLIIVDIFDKIRKDRGPFGKYQKVGHGYFMFPKLEGEIAPHMKFRGKEVLTWSLNNYIGLANHPEVRKTDAEGAKKYGSEGRVCPWVQE